MIRGALIMCNDSTETVGAGLFWDDLLSDFSSPSAVKDVTPNWVFSQHAVQVPDELLCAGWSHAERKGGNELPAIQFPHMHTQI